MWGSLRLAPIIIIIIMTFDTYLYIAAVASYSIHNDMIIMHVHVTVHGACVHALYLRSVALVHLVYSLDTGH